MRYFYTATFFKLKSFISDITDIFERSGPGYSNLTTSLVNVSIKFQTLISEICQSFLLKKCEKFSHGKSFTDFFNKNFSVFGYKVVKHLRS